MFWFGVRGQRGAAFSALPSLWASTNVPLTCELVGDNRGPSRLTAELRHRGGKDLGAVELWSGGAALLTPGQTFALCEDRLE